MTNAEMMPFAVEGEPGRLRGDLLLSHSIDPTTNVVMWIIVLITVLAVGVTVIALFRGPRVRSAGLALTKMLTVSAPLLGIFAAASCLFPALLDNVDPDPAATGELALALAEGTFSITLGAFAGVVGAVLTAALRLAPVRRPREQGSGLAADSNLSKT